MAENEKTTPKTFKFGDNEYTISDYNSSYDKYVADFIDFAKQKGQFDDANLKLLQEALLTKRGQINNGDELNHLGGHNDDSVHNVSIPTYERRGLRKKEKYVDQDITEWVNYFNRSIIGKMNKYNSEKNPKDWDINKYGLLTAFNTRNAESYFNDYDKALGDGTTPRGFTQRNAELLAGLQRYNNILKDYNFDYTKNDDWRDNDYQTILKDLETELTNTNPNQQKIAQLLRNAGFTDDYVTAFTSDQHKWNESLTQTASAYKAEQDTKAKQQIEEQAKKEQEALNAKNKQIRDAIQQQWTTRMSKYYLPHEFSNISTFPILTPEHYNSWLNDNYITNVHKGNKNTAISTLSSIYEDINKNRIESEYWKDFNKYWFYHKMNSENPLNTINHDNVTYYTFPMPDDHYHYTMGFDPNTGKSIKYYYLNGTDQERQQVFKKWLERNIKALSTNVNFSETDIKNAFSNYFPYTDIVTGVFKEGGILFAQQGSELNAINNYINKEKQKTEAEYQRQADEAGISVEALKAKKRRVFGDEKFYDDNVGLTGTDVAHLVAAGANLVSIFLDPVSGFFTGLGSSLTDFGADLFSDDVSFGQSLKGLAGNVGMDLLGIIPGIGDSVGTMGKIRKTLVHYAPRIIGYLGTYSSLQNTPQIIDSFQKLIDDKDDITRDDIRNIVEGINLLATGSQAGRHHIASSKARQTATTGNDKIQLQVKNTVTGKNETIVVEGNAAKDISKNVSHPDKINEILKNHEGFNNYEVRTDRNWFPNLQMPRKDGKWRTPIKWNQNGQVEHFDANLFRNKYKEYYFGTEKAHLHVSPGGTVVSNRHPNISKTITDKTKTKEKVEKETIKKYQKQLNKQKTQLDNLYESVKDYNTKHEEYQTKLNGNESSIQTKQSQIADLSKKITDLEIQTKGKQDLPENEIDKIKQTIKELTDNKSVYEGYTKPGNSTKDIHDANAELNKIEAQLKENNQKLVDAENFKKLREKQNELSKLSREKDGLETEGDELIKLRSELEKAKLEFDELLAKTKKFHKKSYNYKFNDETYSIKKPVTINFDDYKFQYGGKINKEKLNKFLNYAKR